MFHVQNAPWATQFLLRKFNINNRDDLIGTDFGKFVKYKRPERRGGKPFTSGKTWKTVRGKLSFSSIGISSGRTSRIPRDFSAESTLKTYIVPSVLVYKKYC